MYNVVFESDTGEKYYFGEKGNTVFDMDLGNGVPVDIGTSQGFSQIGVSVQRRTISSRPINVKGVVYGNVQERKRSMRKIISPLSSGRLVFENRYYTRVYVADAPSFSSVKSDGRFSMRFVAPYPFFFDINEKVSEIGAVKPMFEFPVNYSSPHKFGEKSAATYSKITNDGDVKVPFSVYLKTSGTSSNIVIANLSNFQTLKINGTISPGDFIHIYRDAENVLRANLTSNGITSDIISWIDESSELFELNVGDNLISATDDDGGHNLTAKITFNPAVVALYES